ncbi:peptidoglycan-binding protein LysM [Aliiroseovarius zhejiangensis]|uniref:Peptidoglycan-binding protein LysM n=1 Tax=Aliiroseovarius zhejiangensis TaxID=1632025 RepID=A0ABQ3IKR9_9RHOB|nr:LysM peptidoglycan-binding domain-containing protein [Aliiroseovarius zhejiangensis]GHE86726.1 peptidoglycan-binding protein LysM [Aliiroseovarius zhejiangensis]
MTTETGNTGNRTGYFVVAGVVLALGAGLAFYLGTRNRDAVDPSPVAQTPAPTNTPQAAETSPADTVPAPAPDTDATAALPPKSDDQTKEMAGESPGSEDASPGFDVVRVDPEGNAVIAGHAAPGSTVQLTLDGAPLEDVTVGSDGNFVALLDLPITSPGALGLTMLDDSGQAIENGQSPQTVLIAPTRPVPDTAAVAEAEVVAEAPETGDTLAPSGAGALSSPDGSDTVASAPQVLLADDEGIAVLQDGTGRPQVDNIVIDAITYDDAGDVALSGRGQGGANLRVYLDNEPIEIGEVSESGQWRVPLPKVDGGVYTLRVDELAADGTVTSRTETPFKREEPAQLTAANTGSETPTTRVAAVTVQPGSTLWAIAREHLGEGPLYVRVFAANRGQIRDPDLIYPGQVFTIPNPE